MCQSFILRPNSSNLLSAYAAFCLLFHPSVDTWAASTFWLLRIMLLWAQVHRYLFETLLSIILDLTISWTFSLDASVVFMGSCLLLLAVYYPLPPTSFTSILIMSCCWDSHASMWPSQSCSMVRTVWQLRSMICHHLLHTHQCWLVSEAISVVL